MLPSLNYQDYTRALTGRQNLLNLGTDVETGVRYSGQAQEQMLNGFNLSNFQNQMQLANANNTWETNAAAQKGAGIGSLISIGSGAISGGLQGFLTGGPAGAAIGAFTGGLGAASGNSSGIGSLLSTLGSFGSKSPSNAYSDINMSSGMR